MKTIKVWAFDERKKKRVFVGTIRGKNFLRLVHPKKHLFRRFNAYGIQESAFQTLVSNEVETVKMMEPLRTLVSTMEDWKEKSITDQNFGSGKQRFLPLDLMIEENVKL